MRYFVWIGSHTGPVAQIWDEDACKDGAGKSKPTLKSVSIANNDPRAIDELKKDYPYDNEAKS